jgi:hypothetical protein
MSTRTVFAEDALNWLNSSEIDPDSSFVASLPDISEFPNFTLGEWKEWFISAAKLIMSRCPDEGVSIFYQSDIKLQGVWIDKAYLCQKAAEEMGLNLLWHKIICRAPVGIATFGKPSFSHLLCFSKKVQVRIEKSTADVLPEMGDKTWQRGMGLETCLSVARFIVEETNCTKLINPFCGHGSMLAAANVYGLDAIGIERSPKRAQKARLLKISQGKKRWILSDEAGEEL